VIVKELLQAYYVVAGSFLGVCGVVLGGCRVGVGWSLGDCCGSRVVAEWLLRSCWVIVGRLSAGCYVAVGWFWDGF